MAAVRTMASAQGAAVPQSKWAVIRRKIWASRYLYLLFFLPFVYFIVFKYGAMVWLTIAFKDYNAIVGLFRSPWVGFKYFKIFFAAPDFFRLLRNTLLLSVYSLLWGFPMPIILALLINEVHNKRFKKIVQNISYLPHFFSTVIVCGIVVNMLSTSGIVNQFLSVFNLGPVAFLTNPRYFRTIYIASGIWQGVGWGSIVYLAALSGVDPGLYESAIIDGAGKLQQMWYISIPSILPIISQVFSYITNHYGEELYLDLIAQRVNMNPKYLSRVFKAKVGITITEYIGMVRISKAKELLIKTDMKIEDIGTAVGFENRTTFFRLFKKIEGMPPNRFRKDNTP